MDWLEASALFLLGWFGKKLKRFAEGVLDITWFLIRCTPAWRCYFFTKPLHLLPGGSHRAAEGGTLKRSFCKARPAVHRLGKRRSIADSMIGGIPETQEVLDFCAEYRIVVDIERIRAEAINDAYERMLKGHAKYRFVIEGASYGACAVSRGRTP
jgi:hypothetical protein